ncbi:hypothetical protein AQEC111735_12065 [Aquirufa ecclesiirivi]
MPVTTKRVAVPALMLTLPEVTGVPEAGVKVNVPVPAVPVKVNLLVKLAIPELKSATLLIKFEPFNPETVPVNEDVTVIALVEALKVVATLP